jgi:PAS domain S-box-containing protein
MKDVPDIIKELREEEKLGKLKSNSEHVDNILDEEKNYYEKSDGTVHVFEESLKKVKKDFNFEDIEEKFEILFENYEVAVTFADENERIISWNKCAEELLNMNEKDLFLRSVESLYPPGEWDKIRNENVRKKGMKYKLETQILRKNKEPLDVELTLCILKGRETNIAGSIGIIRDITKLKNIEKKLIESEEKYKTIFENSAVAIILTDEKERIISWNKYVEKLLKMDKKQLHMKPVKSLYPPEEWQKIRKKNIRQKGMQHHLETKILRGNDDLINVDISISVLKNHEGEITGSIGVMKDISEQKKIENELEYKHNLLQSLLDNIPDCIYFKDENSKFIKVNNAKAKRVNSDPKKIIGKTEYDFYPEDIARASLEDDKKLMEKKKSIINKVEKIQDEKGVEHWISVTKIPRFSKDGEIIGSMGISRDITELKKSEERYRNLFETAIDPIVILDKEGTFIDINEQVTKTLGYDKNELIGKKFDEVEILTKDSLNQSLESFSKLMQGKAIPIYEVKVVTRNGEIIPAEINANALSENGKIVGDLIIIRDLRDRYKRKEVERELVESENRFRNIFDATSDFLLYLEKGIILDLNETALNIGGFTKKDVIGKTFSELKEIFSEEDMKKHLETIQHAKSGVKLHDYESYIKAHDGQIYMFLFSADCIRDDKKVKGLLIRGRDITQRQRAWDELVKLEEKYRVLAETSADGVITIDPLGRLTYVNPSFEKLCSRRKSQILATLFRDYLSEDSVYFFQQVFIDARKNDEKIENVELELINLEEEIIPIEVNIAPVQKNNEFAGMVCTIRDITERRRIEDELKKSERLRTEFMNIAAHELKSPVTPIKGYLDLIISDKNTSEKVKNWAKVSLRNSERLLKLVNDILDVSRLDTDTMRFEMERLDIVEILDEIAEDMKPVIENKSLKFITKIPRNLPNIMGDRHRLPQVLKNLLVNALKFTDNGSISIEAEEKDNYIIISIKDTGVGISKEELKKIFTKFYQAYTGDDRKNEGTGLGLFICKEILHKHKGDIWVESNIGKGSNFMIKLPYLHKMVVDLQE